MAWVNWSRRTTPAAMRAAGGLGLELTSSLARAAAGRQAHNRVVLLDEPHADLPLAINVERRPPQVGRPGVALIRKLPHLACVGFLPHCGRPSNLSGGPRRLNVEDALGLVFDRLRVATAGFETVDIGLPPYLVPTQVAKLKSVANKHRFAIRGTVSSHLALAADRAEALLAGHPLTVEREEGIVPMHRPGQTNYPADAIVVDADEYALTGSLIRMEPEQIAVVATTTLPRVGAKQWTDRLVDGFADRCVRACRRDPRDSAESEQSLYEQIEAGLDVIRSGRHVTLSVRAGHWCQEMHLQPEDFETCCSALIRSSVDGIRELLNSASALEPPRAVWLTHAAGRLPGLAQAIYQNMAERTSLGVLRPEATAIAVANLGERWPDGAHLDASIPRPKPLPENKPQPPSVKTHRS